MTKPRGFFALFHRFLARLNQLRCTATLIYGTTFPGSTKIHSASPAGRKSKLTFRHLKQGIQRVHNNFVLAPADKTGNTALVVLRLHYLYALLLELNRFKKVGYNLNIMRQTTCQVLTQSSLMYSSVTRRWFRSFHFSSLRLSWFYVSLMMLWWSWGPLCKPNIFYFMYMACTKKK